MRKAIQILPYIVFLSESDFDFGFVENRAIVPRPDDA